MRWMTFDLETARLLPPETFNLIEQMPLGIACAAIAFSDRETELFHGGERLTAAEAAALVRRLQALEAEGYRLVTWNGCSFDLRVLADESGLWKECGALALNHVDLMAWVVCANGYRLSLQTALDGAGLGGKLRGFALPDGTLIDPSGANAPRVWADGHREAVLAYLRHDVEQLGKLVTTVAARRALSWKSKSGRPMQLSRATPPTVRECLAMPLPDTSWMRNDPPSRSELIEWIPELALNA